jgi:hypothetical protein
MFEEIPSPSPSPSSPSRRQALAILGIMFTFFLGASVVAWIRWSRPLSPIHKFIAAEFIVGIGLSGILLLTARTATPENNRKRIEAFFFFLLAFQVITDVLQ